MDLHGAVEWATRLADPEQRADGLGEFARSAGAEDGLLLVGDDESGVMLPAPGMRQTLPRGRRWRSLLRQLATEGTVRGEVEALGGDGTLPVLAHSEAGLAMVLMGDRAEPAMLEAMRPVWSLLGHLLACEQRARATAGELRTARSEMRQHASQARVLDETRLKLDETVRKLGEEARRATEAARAKDEFLAMLGHELRNPLAPIVMTLEVLRMRDAWRPELDVVERQVHHMKRLMDDLLDVSRIARGKLTLDLGPVDLAEVLQLARESAPEWSSRRQPLEWDVPDRGLWVSGDRARLVQVFSNLLDNAAKYSNPSSVIRVHARGTAGGAVLVTVQDDGIGIAPGQLEEVFEIFEQGGRAGAFAGGLGLGLAIVRNLVHHHDGRVWAESEGQGHGSRFNVELPVLAGDRMPDAVAPAEQARMSGVRVMVVDDNEDARITLGWMLRLSGCTVLELDSGAEALANASSFGPDIAVLDLGMPGMDGMTLARRLRESMGNHAPSLIALTGFGQPADRARAQEAGFDAYLVKPVVPEELERTIHQLRAPCQP
ncbi:MAG TPA: ATP-binding protein [Xanthomonadaceae bacterium]|nr:ATP-binding protein [Xanthomonadaceae bacterium]